MKTIARLFSALCTAIVSVPAFSAPELVDPSFNPILVNPFVPKILVQPDGKILIQCGSPLFARLNPDGTFDPTFNSSISDGNLSELLPDGKILIRLVAVPPWDDTHVGIARLNSDGTRDTTFDTAASVVDGGVNATVTQANGKVVVGVPSLGAWTLLGINSITALPA